MTTSLIFFFFLSAIMPNYDWILIIADFNLHVCCPTVPLVKDFLNLIDSFNLVQSLTGSTREHGHTLDLVLSCGIPVSFHFFLITCLFCLRSFFLVTPSIPAQRCR